MKQQTKMSLRDLAYEYMVTSINDDFPEEVKTEAMLAFWGGMIGLLAAMQRMNKHEPDPKVRERVIRSWFKDAAEYLQEQCDPEADACIKATRERVKALRQHH